MPVASFFRFTNSRRVAALHSSSKWVARSIVCVLILLCYCQSFMFTCFHKLHKTMTKSSLWAEESWCKRAKIVAMRFSPNGHIFHARGQLWNKRIARKKTCQELVTISLNPGSKRHIFSYRKCHLLRWGRGIGVRFRRIE